MSIGLDSFEASKFLLVWAAIVCGIASLLSFLHDSSGAPRPLGRTFLSSVVALAIIYQFHLLVETSMHNPSGIGENLYRWECLRSDKGGKRPWGAAGAEYRNPCYNRTADGNETDAEASREDILGENEPSSSSLCPSTNVGDGDAPAVEPYISAARDCRGARSGRCGLDEPCTPCELSRAAKFCGEGRGWTRCRACTARDHGGGCDFVAGVGPYCWKAAGSWEVVPCETCCTEDVPMFDEDGVCY